MFAFFPLTSTSRRLSSSTTSKKILLLTGQIPSSQRRCFNWRAFLPRKEIRTIPNMITCSRILASPFLGYAVATDMKVTALTGCVVFGISDWLDGYLAKRLNQRTTLGAFLDPLADKLTIGALAAGLTWQGLLPWPLFTLFMVRDVSLITCAFIIRLLDKPANAGIFDMVDNATVQIVPSDISKVGPPSPSSPLSVSLNEVNTFVQFSLLGTTLSHLAFAWPVMGVIEPLWWIAATTTIWSGLGYIVDPGVQRLSSKVSSIVKERKEERKK
eukprot:scaffold633_cov288-Ochromonas_danica.AAC.10